jgi:hypothetical protein
MSNSYEGKKLKVRFEVILPSFYNDGKKIEIEKFWITKREMAQRFGGCTFLSPSWGVWVDPTDKKEYDEENTGFYVDVEENDANIEFFKEYKRTLQERFQQREVRITYHPITEL